VFGEGVAAPFWRTTKFRLSRSGIVFLPGKIYGSISPRETATGSGDRSDSFLATVRIFAYEPLIKERVYEMCVANVLAFNPRFAGISRTILEEARALCLQQMCRQRCAVFSSVLA